MNTTRMRLAAFSAALLLASCSEAPLSGPSALHLPEQVAAVVSALNTPPTGSFRYTPITRAGQAPLAFEVNMCRSIDPDVTDNLRFVVSWGDGTSDRGLCYLRHTYEKPGRYDGRACVSDRVLGSPESCEDFVVDVVAEDTPGEKALEPFLTSGMTFLGRSNIVSTTVFLGRRIAAAEVASAKLIVITFGNVSANTGTGGQLGVGLSNSTFIFAPDNFGGRTGTLSTQLLPSQTNGAGIDSIVFATPGGTFSFTDGAATVTLYR